MTCPRIPQCQEYLCLKAPFLGAALITVAFLASTAWGVEIGLDPLIGDGAAGRQTVLSGAGFPPSSSYSVTFGGYAASPSSVSSDAAGVVPSTTLFLQAMPAGPHDVILTGIVQTHTFTGAYRVWRNVCISPATGNGRPGQTSAQNPSLPAGGWDGMVFRLEGRGFAANATIAANSITVGGATTMHGAISVDSRGGFASTTVIVASGLSYGLKNIYVNDGVSATTFYGAYMVRRSIGMNPAVGGREAGNVIAIGGWGFTDGTLPANSITVGGFSTTHAAATISNGAFSLSFTLNSKVPSNPNDVSVVQETFPSAYEAAASPLVQMAVTPIMTGGMPNQCLRIQGVALWGDGTIPADSTELRDGSQTATTTQHGAITCSGGIFPATWIKTVGGQEYDTDRIAIYVPSKGQTRDFSCVTVRSTLDVCPVVSSGKFGFTCTLSGYGFIAKAVIPADSITVNGATATHAAATVGDPSGYFGPVALALPAIPFGERDIGIDDGTARIFSGLLDARRTIGLSFVNGPGIAGEITGISGGGFTASSNISANSITFQGTPMTHPAIAVAANGSFSVTPITLPDLAAGTYDVAAQETFIQAYRVNYGPRMVISKYCDPPSGATGSIVTYTLAFTNIGRLSAINVVLHDSIPAGMQYSAGSAACTPAALIEWYDGAWQTSEPAPAAVQQIRWTLSAPLPSGASGAAIFDVLVQ